MTSIKVTTYAMSLLAAQKNVKKQQHLLLQFLPATYLQVQLVKWQNQPADNCCKS